MLSANHPIIMIPWLVITMAKGGNSLAPAIDTAIRKQRIHHTLAARYANDATLCTKQLQSSRSTRERNIKKRKMKLHNKHYIGDKNYN